MSFFKLLWKIISGFFESHVTRANDALEDRDWLAVVLHMAAVVITGAVGITVPIFLVYKFRRLILAIATPIIILAVLIASFYENYKKPKPSAQPLACLSIDETRDSATGKYRPMSQCAFLLFTDLCRYLPGLVKPFSLASVEAPVHFDVTANMVTLFHFNLARERGYNEFIRTLARPVDDPGGRRNFEDRHRPSGRLHQIRANKLC